MIVIWFKKLILELEYMVNYNLYIIIPIGNEGMRAVLTADFAIGEF